MIAQTYPKISQEMLREVVLVLSSTMANDAYLEASPYSKLMRDAIREQTKKFSSELTRGIIGVNIPKSKPAVTLESSTPKLTPAEIEAQEMKEIEEQFESLSEGLDNRSSSYRDDFKILVRVEKTIRSIQRLMTYGGTDSVKLTATTRFMELQEKQLDILERLMNLEKVSKIEALSKRFFNELKNHPDLKTVAARYLSLIEELD